MEYNLCAKWIKKILLDISYLNKVVNAQIAKKIAQFSTLKRLGPQNCLVYLRVAWIGSPPQTWKKKSKQPWKAAPVPSALAWSLRQSVCCQRSSQGFLLTTQKIFVIYCANTSATVIIGRWGEHLNDHRITSSNMFPNGKGNN